MQVRMAGTRISTSCLLVLVATSALFSSLAWACPFMAAQGGDAVVENLIDTQSSSSSMEESATSTQGSTTSRHLLQSGQSCAVPVRNTYTTSPTTNFWGNVIYTLEHADLKTTNQRCRDWCNARCDCMGFTWDQGGANIYSPRPPKCIFVDYIERSYFAQDMSAHTRDLLCPRQCAEPVKTTYTAVASTNFWGNVIDSMYGDDLFTSNVRCIAACTVRCDCLGFVWDKGIKNIRMPSCVLVNTIERTSYHQFLTTYTRDKSSCIPLPIFNAPIGPVKAATVDCATRVCWRDAMSKEMDEINKVRPGGLILSDILRLAFHDCGAGRCDASVLLDRNEWFAPENPRLEGVEEIQRMKNKAAASCGKIPSYADTLLFSTAIGLTKATDGRLDLPDWIPLGRPDWVSTDSKDFNRPNRLPGVRDNMETLHRKFHAMFGPLGATEQESLQALVSLSGAHTIGESACVHFAKDRAQAAGCSDRLRCAVNTQCHPKLPCLLQPFDLDTPFTFDNKYFQLLRQNEGLLVSDQLLYATDFVKTRSSREIVDLYANDQNAWFDSFGRYFLSMSLIGTNNLQRPTQKCPQQPPPAPVAVVPLPICFPGDATVLLQDGSTLTMSNLNVGDNVATVDPSGALRFDPIYFFGHRVASKLALFLQVHVSSLTPNSTLPNKVLEISPLHFVHTDSPSSPGKWNRHRTARAATLKPGSTLWLLDGAQLTMGRVTRVETVYKYGLYNPYTTGGSIVVNGVLASAHSDWVLDHLVPSEWDHHLPALYQGMFSPLRAMYNLIGPAKMEAFHQKLSVAKSGSALHTFRELVAWQVESA